MIRGRFVLRPLTDVAIRNYQLIRFPKPGFVDAELVQFFTRRECSVIVDDT